MRKTYLPYAMQWIDDEDIAEVVTVLRGDWLTTGPAIRKFENSLCDYVKCKHGVAVNSGTAALDIAIASLKVKKGEIITTPFTFASTSNAILFNGMKPVFADITADTFNIDPMVIEKKITAKTRAIIYVDFAGQPCNIKEIKEIAAKHSIYLIEDAAHALGAEYEGQKVGGFADITEFSFHPVKHITCGEGGMCVTNNENLAERMGMLRNHGMDKDAMERYGPDASWAYDVKLLSRNYRITDFQAALGASQLRKIEKFITRREEIVRAYNEAFKDFSEIIEPFVKSNVRHVWHLYTILLKGINRDRFFKLMRQENIGVNVHYIPIYKHSYYKRFKFNLRDFPVTEKVFKSIVTLPLFPRMTDEDVSDVCKAVKETIRKLKP